MLGGARFFTVKDHQQWSLLVPPLFHHWTDYIATLKQKRVKKIFETQGTVVSFVVFRLLPLLVGMAAAFLEPRPQLSGMRFRHRWRTL